MSKITIVVVDDHPAFLQKLTSLLAVEFEILATASNGKSALDLIRHWKPEAVVLDLAIPIFNGIVVTRELKKRLPMPHVVICSVENDPEVVEAAHQAGASAYVLKSRISRDLISAVKLAVQGKPFLSLAADFKELGASQL